MVRHIFKKDLKLLWIFVGAVASLHWISAFIVFKLGLFGEDPMLALMTEALPPLAFFATMFLIAGIVHLDAIPGVRQDWLVRPIERRDLLLEKLLFVVVMAGGPVFVADLLQGLANGFSLRSSFLAAISHFVFFLFLLVLPIFAFVSVTQNMTEAFIFGCGCTFIMGAFLAVSSDLNNWAHGMLTPVVGSGVGWLGEVFRFALVALAAGIILTLQYSRRKTTVSRFLVVVFGLLLLTSEFLPWKPAFAIEQRLSPKPLAGANAVIAFDPGRGKFLSPSGLTASSENDQRDGGVHTGVFLPVHVAGIHENAFVLSDRVEVRFIGEGERIAFHGIGEGFEIAKQGPQPVDEHFYQEIELPVSIYRGIKDQPMRAEVDYSLTVFGLSKSYAIQALGGDERMPGFGWCETKMNEAGSAIELHCMEPGMGPICGMAFLENSTTGTRNPDRSSCRSDYTPYPDRPMDDMARFGVNVPFRDPSGLAKFPVDGAQLLQSRVVIRMYSPEDHFTRQVVIPQIRLKDWEAQ